MRKFTLFLSLIVAFVTATAQEVTVTSLDQLSNDKTYFIESARCFLMNNTTANADGISTSTAKNLGTSTVAKDWTDANQQFKIEQIDGNYYLYSVGAAKYVAKDGSWSDTAVDALEFTPSSNSTYNWKLCIGGNGMNSQEPGQMDAGIVVNGWTTEDPGNCYKILDTEASTIVVVDYPNELAEFDQNKCYTVTTTSRGGWAVKDNQFCSTVDAALGTNSNPEDANQQFAVLSIDGENYYLYSVGAQMFVNSDKSLVAGIGEAIELTDASKMGDCRVRVNFKGYSDKYINLGGGKQMEVNDWGTIDAGNAVAFIEAGEFDPTAALAMLQPAAPEPAPALAVVSQTPAADEVVESFNAITIEFNKAIEFIQAAGGTGGTDGTGGTNGTDATGGTNGTDATGSTNGTTGGTSGPAQYIKLKDANNGVVATAWVSAATIDGNKVTFVFEMNAAISKTGTYSFAIPAGLIKATDGEEFAGQTFTFQVEEPVKLAVVSQTPAADEVVESFSSITIEFNKAIEFIQAAGGTGGTDGTGGTNGTDATGGTNGTDATGSTNGTTGGTSGPAQYIKLKDANNGVVATYWVSAATIDGATVTFVPEMNATISNPGTYTFTIPAGLIKATDGEEFAGETFTFEVSVPEGIEDV